MQLHAPFVCLKLPTEKSSTRRLFCGPNPSGLRDGAPWIFRGAQSVGHRQGEIVIKTMLASVLTLGMLFLGGMAFAQTDPGVQSGNRGTGTALPSVLANDKAGILAFFTDGQARFQEVESVSGGANNGLGPRFNTNSCSSCHAQPTVGGTGAAANPQFQFTSNGVAPANTTPSFI